MHVAELLAARLAHRGEAAAGQRVVQVVLLTSFFCYTWANSDPHAHQTSESEFAADDLMFVRAWLRACVQGRTF